MEDRELVRKSLENKQNFRYIVEQFEKPLLRYIRRLLYLSTNDSDDILQETFIQIYRNLNQFDFTFKLSSWIYRIAHNVAISHLRKSKNKNSISLTQEELERIVKEDSSDLLNRYSKEEVNKALNILEVKYQEILVLRFFEELSYSEISDVLKIPVGTAGSLLKRGIDKLKILLPNE